MYNCYSFRYVIRTNCIENPANHRLNMELDIQSLFGLHVNIMCTAVLIG
jgi:hypothetical protein